MIAYKKPGMVLHAEVYHLVVQPSSGLLYRMHRVYNLLQFSTLK